MCYMFHFLYIFPKIVIVIIHNKIEKCKSWIVLKEIFIYKTHQLIELNVKASKKILNISIVNNIIKYMYHYFFRLLKYCQYSLV